MFDKITILNKDQANDFIRTHMQNNIEVIDIERESNIYHIMIRSGKWYDRKEVTIWNYSPKRGLSFGKYTDPCFGKEYSINDFDEELMEKANAKVRRYVENWEKVSPV